MCRVPRVARGKCPFFIPIRYLAIVADPHLDWQDGEEGLVPNVLPETTADLHRPSGKLRPKRTGKPKPGEGPLSKAVEEASPEDHESERS